MLSFLRFLLRRPRLDESHGSSAMDLEPQAALSVWTDLRSPPLFDYRGGPVSLERFENAMDFFVVLERAFLERNGEADTDEYRRLEALRATEAAMAQAAVRRFGEDIAPRTLERMREVFYSVVDGRYEDDAVANSAARSLVNAEWHGIGDWRR